jgi:hypothetical protein
MAYRNLRGSLNVGRRIEQSVGHATWMITAAAGMKKSCGSRFRPDDFMPHEKMDYPEFEDVQETQGLDDDYFKPGFTRLN